MAPNAVEQRLPLAELLAQRRWLGHLARALVAPGLDAEDLVQDTWVAAVAHRPSADRDLKPWLARVARNLSANRAVGARRRRAREAEVASSSAQRAAASAEDLLTRRQAEDQLARLLDQLAEPYRQTLVLRYFEERSAADIARLQGLPAGTVRWRLKRGLEELRASLDEENQDDRGQRWGGLLLPVLRSLWLRPTLTVAALGLVATALLLWGRWSQADRPSLAAQSAAERQVIPPPAAVALARLLPAPGSVPRFLARVPAVAAAATLIGRVLDPDGRPLGGAAVLGWRQATGTPADPDAGQLPPTITDAGGNFRFKDLAAGYYNLFASASGLAVGGRVTIEVPTGETTVADVTLQQGGAILTGKVVDADAGPIVGAEVRVQGVAGRSGSPEAYPRYRQGTLVAAFNLRTDAQGNFRVQLPHLGYQVQVRASGYARVRDLVELRADVTRQYQLHPTAPLRGRVVSRWGHRPVAQAEVFAVPVSPAVAGDGAAGPGAERSSSDEEGNFQFPDLRPGEYQLLARKTTLVGALDDVVAVREGVEVAAADITIENGLEVRGTVRQQQGQGGPAAGAVVKLIPTDGRNGCLPGGAPLMIADQRGGFSFNGLLPGYYRLEVRDRHDLSGHARGMALRESLALEVALPPPAAGAPPSRE